MKKSHATTQSNTVISGKTTSLGSNLLVRCFLLYGPAFSRRLNWNASVVSILTYSFEIGCVAASSVLLAKVKASPTAEIGWRLRAGAKASSKALAF